MQVKRNTCSLYCAQREGRRPQQRRELSRRDSRCERELRARVHRAGDGPVDVGRFATLCHYKFCTSIRTESRFVEHPATRTAGGHRRLPEHDRHPDRRRRRRGARAARAAPRERLRARRHRRRRARPRPPARRRQRRRARGAAPRRRRRRADGRPSGGSASRSRSGPTRTRRPRSTRELEREYRAVVEEILELRGDDGSIARFLRSITEPGALADTAGYSPDLTFEQKVELLETARRRRSASSSSWRLQRERLAEMQVRRRIREDVESGRGQAAARVHPAPADGVDPQGARRGRRLRRRRVPREDRRGRHAGRRPRAGRARARPPRADGRAAAPSAR